jgi:hypothetical protein
MPIATLYPSATSPHSSIGSEASLIRLLISPPVPRPSIPDSRFQGEAEDGQEAENMGRTRRLGALP